MTTGANYAAGVARWHGSGGSAIKDDAARAALQEHAHIQRSNKMASFTESNN